MQIDAVVLLCMEMERLLSFATLLVVSCVNGVEASLRLFHVHRLSIIMNKCSPLVKNKTKKGPRRVDISLWLESQLFFKSLYYQQCV
jgi:hypothetical protein